MFEDIAYDFNGRNIYKHWFSISYDNELFNKGVSNISTKPKYNNTEINLLYWACPLATYREFLGPKQKLFPLKELNGWNSFVLFGRDRKINKS